MYRLFYINPCCSERNTMGHPSTCGSSQGTNSFVAPNARCGQDGPLALSRPLSLPPFDDATSPGCPLSQFEGYSRPSKRAGTIESDCCSFKKRRHSEETTSKATLADFASFGRPHVGVFPSDMQNSTFHEHDSLWAAKAHRDIHRANPALLVHVTRMALDGPAARTSTLFVASVLPRDASALENCFQGAPISYWGGCTQERSRKTMLHRCRSHRRKSAVIWSDPIAHWKRKAATGVAASLHVVLNERIMYKLCWRVERI
jgi:hypothetical protein